MTEPTEQSMIAKADAAFLQAAEKVVRLARQTGTLIITWDHERGHVRAISPDEAQERLSGIPSPEAPGDSERNRPTPNSH